VLGAIVGDIVGSRFEHLQMKSKDFPLFARGCKFTDDTVLNVAVANALLTDKNYAKSLKAFTWRRPFRGYGNMHSKWVFYCQKQPFNSFGNGSAMRVSPVAYAANTLEEVQVLARESAECTHNHPEGIRGAQAIASCILLARQNATKEQIRDLVRRDFGYDLVLSLDQIRPSYRFDSTCPGSVPQAIQSILESTDFEDAVRNAISLGGDADTLAALAGSIAEPFYGGVPKEIISEAIKLLPRSYCKIISTFYTRYGVEKYDSFRFSNYPSDIRDAM